MSRPSFVGMLALLAIATIAPARLDAAVPPGAETPAVQRGLQYLRGRSPGSRAGESALMALVMNKSGVPSNDPALIACLNAVVGRFSGSSYSAQEGGEHDVYELGCVAMALSNIDAKLYKEQIQGVANLIVGRQSANGGWDYSARPNMGDTSLSQYAMLGLWEAVEQGGATVKPEVWDRAAKWLIASQAYTGSWTYRRDAPEMGGETISMTSAGAGCLLICKSQLAPYFKPEEPINPLLIPIETETSKRKYTAQVSATAVDTAVGKGIGWITSNYTIGDGKAMGQTPYYSLYGLERIGALARLDKIGPHAWFAEGRSFIEGRQDASGSWNATHGPDANTCWALLYLVRANAATVKKIDIKRLGTGTLLGGRGLPKNLADLTVSGGRVVVRPMNAAISDMLKVLEDPRAENADAALAGLMAEYDKHGPRVLLPLKDRLRKLLSDPDPGVRKIAAWSLARTGELDVAPALIAALRDPDPQVMIEARNGLLVLSRKVAGYGPTLETPLEQRGEAIRKWREWYNAARPFDQVAEADDTPAAPTP